MIYSPLSIIAIALTIVTSCSPSKEYASRKPKQRIVGDTTTTVQYVETSFEARQKSDLKEMIGTWEVVTMKRQQKANKERLTNVYFELKADSTFSGEGGCNSMGGRLEVKGSSIKFSSIIATKMACANIEQETIFFTLLENTVSEYSFGGKELLLRDGASNVVFECARK